MIDRGITESVIEQAALAWLESLGWTVKHGPEIAPEELAAERKDFGQVVLEQRLQDALARLNPQLPAEALKDAFRKLTHAEGATPEARNRAVHRLLVDGVTVEYRAADGGIRGAQARVIVKRILRKYGYPPDKQEKATQTVLEQAEVLSAEWAVA